jgi:transcriptional regulator with XRE-family HTH domain
MGNKEFAERLKKARLNAGLTQKQVYEKLNVPQSTFSSWETGRSEPDAKTLITLCKLYGINDLSYFDTEKIAEKIMREYNINQTPKYV